MMTDNHVPAGYIFNTEARLKPKVQPHRWRIVPGVREDIEMTLITHLGNHHATLHLTYEEAGKLALELMKVRGVE